MFIGMLQDPNAPKILFHPLEYTTFFLSQLQYNSNRRDKNGIFFFGKRKRSQQYLLSLWKEHTAFFYQKVLFQPGTSGRLSS
jgi:hypothetical protein